MEENIVLHPIARIHSGFDGKFGVPRQSGLADTTAEVVFEPPYRSPEAVRGLDTFSHIWLIWCFSENIGREWHPTVRPPRLGGNVRVGVFASRSPFRPNPIALSSVRLVRIEMRGTLGPVLIVSGADLVNGTPILDIKPYAPIADCHKDATGGFTERQPFHELQVEIPEEVRSQAVRAAAEPEQLFRELTSILRQDPRPQYQNDPERVYGMDYRGCNVRFQIRGDTLTITEITKNTDQDK